MKKRLLFFDVRQRFPKVVAFCVLMLGMMLSNSLQAQVINEGFEEAGWVSSAGATGSVVTVAGATPTGNNGTWSYNNGSVNTSGGTSSIFAGSKSFFIAGSSSAYLITPIIPGGVATVTFKVKSATTTAAGIAVGFATNTTVTANTGSVSSTAGGNAFSIQSSTYGGLPLSNAGSWSTITFNVTNTLSTNPGYLKFQRISAGSLIIDDIVVTAAVSLSTPPTLTPAVGATVDNPFNITFTDDATWRSAITSITVGGVTLATGAYSVSAGQITFTPSASALLQSASTKSIAVIATGYTNATASQPIAAGAATKLGITTQPAAPASNGGALATQPVVAIQDQYGNTTSSTATVTAAVGSGTYTLGGTLNQNAVAGVATFSGLTATSTAPVTGATIAFTSSGLTGVTSGTFNIPAPTFFTRTTLAAYTENFDAYAGTAITAPSYFTITSSLSQSGFYNRSSTYSNTNGIFALRESAGTEVALGAKPAANSGTCSGTGTAAFEYSEVNNTGANILGYTINFDFEQYTAAGRATTLTVDYKIGGGGYINLPTATGTATTSGVDANLPSIAVTAKSATITGVTVPNGTQFYLRFTICTGSVGTGNNGHVGIDNLSVAASATAILTPPTLTAAVGATVDAPFNVTFTDDASWRAAISSITVNGVTLDPSAYSISAGVITFTPANSVLLQSPGTKTILVNATGYTAASVSQAIAAGTATQLVITTQPTAPASNGGTLAAQPVLVFRDQYNNTTTTGAGTVTAAVTGAQAWVLGGTTSVSGASGTATFAGLTAGTANEQAFTGATITFTSGAFTVVSTPAFNIPIATGLATDYFRSKIAGGNWNTAGTWETSHDGTTWNGITASAAPTSSAQGIEIQAGSTVTVSANLTTPLPTVVTAIQVNGILEGASGIDITLGSNMIVNAGGELSLVGNNAGSLVTTGRVLTVLGTLSNSNISTTAITSTTSTLLFATASGAGVYNLDGAAVQIPTATWVNGSNAGTVNYNSTASGNSSGPGQTFGDWVVSVGAASAKPFFNSGATTTYTIRDLTINNAITQLTTGGTSQTTNINVRNYTQNASVGLTQYATTVNLLASGNVTISGGTLSQTSGTSTITLNGATGTQTVTGLTGAAVSGNINVVVNKAAGGVTLGSNLTVPGTGNLTLTNGVITTGAFKVILASTGTVSRTNGWVAGNLQKNFGTGATSKTFEIGGASNYRPVTVAFTNVTAAGDLTASVTQAAGEHPQVGASGIDQTKDVNRYFTLTNSGIAFTGSYDATFNYVAGDIDGGATPANFIVRQYNGSAWSATTSPVNTGGVTTKVTSTTLVGTNDFVIGESTGAPTVSVNPSNSTICAGDNTSFTASSTSVPATTVKWQRSTDGIAPYVDITSNLDAGTTYSGFTTGTLTLTGSTVGLNNYHYQAVFTNLNGSVTSTPGILTINATVTAGTVTGSATLCLGSSATYTATGATPGGTWSSTDPTKATVDAGTGVVTSVANGSTDITYTVSSGCGAPVSSFLTVTVSQCTNNWTGTGNWTDGSHWSLGAAPNQYQNVAILSGTPTLNTDFTVGTGTSFAISSGASFVINPTRVFTVAGTADFAGQSVTVVSDATGTGSIGQVTGTLSNATAVTVERFIPASSGRSWRLLTIPVTGTQTVRQAWADNKAPNPNAPVNEASNGRGTLLTGSGFSTAALATAQGFDWATSIRLTASGVRRYNPALSGSWPTASSNAGGTYTKSIPQLTLSEAALERGFMLYVRGDRSVLSGTPNDTRLAPTGTVNVGDQAIGINGTDTFQILPNPYASAIDFASVYSHNSVVMEQFWRWDANNGSTGAYVLVHKIGGVWQSTPTDDGPTDVTHIQSSQAVLVRPATYGSAGTLTVSETDKSNPSSVPVVFTPAPVTATLFSADLQLDNGTAGLKNADGVLAAFSSSYSHQGTDKDDVAKANNFNENMALVRNSARYTVEALPEVTTDEVLDISLGNLTARNYAFRFRATNMAAGLTATLEDSYLKTSTPISLNGGYSSVGFSVTADAASAAANRFKVVFKNGGSLPVALTAKAYQKGSGVQVDWKTVNEQKLQGFEVEKGTSGTSFTKATTVKAIGSSSNSYGWLDAAPVQGTNYYRIKSIGTDGKAAYSQVMKVETGGKQGSIAVYPNPVKTGLLTLQLSNLAKGTYTIVLHDAAGHKVMSQVLEHNGGSATETLTLSSSLAAGMYKLSVGDMVQTVVIEK